MKKFTIFPFLAFLFVTACETEDTPTQIGFENTNILPMTVNYEENIFGFPSFQFNALPSEYLHIVVLNETPVLQDDRIVNQDHILWEFHNETENPENLNVSYDSGSVTQAELENLFCWDANSLYWIAFAHDPTGKFITHFNQSPTAFSLDTQQFPDIVVKHIEITSTSDGDNVVEKNESVEGNLILTNESNTPVAQLGLTIASSNPSVHIQNANVSYPSLVKGLETIRVPFSFSLEGETPNQLSLDVDLSFGGCNTTENEISTYLPSVIHTADDLAGISNAVLYNNEIHFVLAKNSTTFARYPDPNQYWFDQYLHNETGQISVITDNGRAQSPSLNDLTVTPDNDLSYMYREWADIGYSFNGYQYQHSNNSLENVFRFKNDGLYFKMLYDARNTPFAFHFSANGYRLMLSTKLNNRWAEPSMFKDEAVWNSDFEVTLTSNALYFIRRQTTNDGITANDFIRLMEWSISRIDNFSLTTRDLVIGVGISACDLEVDEAEAPVVLYSRFDALSLTKQKNGWKEEVILEADSLGFNIGARADLLYHNDNAYIGYISGRNIEENYSFHIVKQTAGEGAWEEIYRQDNLKMKPNRSTGSVPTLLVKNDKVTAVYTDHENVFRLVLEE